MQVCSKNNQIHQVCSSSSSMVLLFSSTIIKDKFINVYFFTKIPIERSTAFNHDLLLDRVLSISQSLLANSSKDNNITRNVFSATIDIVRRINVVIFNNGNNLENII